MSTEPEGLTEVAQSVRRISGKVNYPIHDFQQLADAMGGEEASVQIGGETYTVGQGRSIFPAYYFPIESEQDLVAKIVNLEMLRPKGNRQQIERGEEMSPTTGNKPPATSFEALDLPKGSQGGLSVFKSRSLS